MAKRKSTTVKERVYPCEICGLPLSDRHHILDFPTNGESLFIMSLCPNCHTLIHLGIGALAFRRKRATEVWESFCKAMGANHPYVKKIENKVYENAELIVDMYTKYYPC